MNYKLSKSKRIQAIIVLAIAAVLVMTGTFAWYSFNQRRVNVFNLVSAPNVNLHDDFAGGPEKDVYVENSGQNPALVRVRLTELLILNGALLPDGAQDDATGTDWHVHTPSENGCAVCDFTAHEYFSWVMNGQKFYMPAPTSAKGFKTDDTYTEPLAVGDLDAVIDYAALLRTAFAGDATLLGYIDEYLGGDATHADELQAAIKTIPDGNTVSNVRQYDGQPDDELVRKLNEVRLTLIPTQIITMQDWIDGTTYSEPCKTGDFWVMDTDGWCYWANALKTGEATGQLLSNVGNIKQTSGELIYKINVVLNATTFADTELNDFFETAQTNGGITENGMLLMFAASGGYVMGADGELYIDDDGGLYRQIVKNESGGYADYTISNTIFAGADGVIGTPDDFAVGDRLSFDGDGNIVKVADCAYAIESFTAGVGGVMYIGVGSGAYFAPVDENGIPAATGERYAIVFAGDDGIVGTDDDAGLEERMFHHIGNGVYVEKDESDQPIQPITYYFSSKIFAEDPFKVDNLDGTAIDAKLGTIFSLTLTVGEEYGVWDDPDTGYTMILKGKEMEDALALGQGNGGIDTIFTMGELYSHSDGKLYINLEDDANTYPTFYLSAMGEDDTFGGLYFGRLVEKDGETMGPVGDIRAGGDGSPEKPFKIRGSNEMRWLMNEVMGGNTFAGKYFEIVKDFSMGNTPVLPIGYGVSKFKGTFDGGGYTISDLKMNVPNADGHVGLFWYIDKDGIVKDLTLENVDITGSKVVGGVAGGSEGTISNVKVLSGKITATGLHAGGIAGANNGGTIENCTNGSEVKGASYVGGVTGFNQYANSILENSYNTGTVTSIGSSSGSGFTGGIAGRNQGMVQNCGNTAVVTGAASSNSSSIGGVVGENNAGTVQTSYNVGNVSGGQNLGGVVGTLFQGNIINSYAWCNVTGIAGAGGTVGRLTGGTVASRIYFVYHKGNVTISSSAGGGIAGVVDPAWGSCALRYAVALADSITGGTNHKGTIVGSLVANRCSLASNNSYDIKQSLAGANTSTANYRVDKVTTQTLDWWQNTVCGNVGAGVDGFGTGFQDTSIWRWDDTAKMPVLVGVTPDGGLNLAGSGEEADPYLITSRADLDLLSSTVSGGDNFEGKYFELANDIDMGAALFTPIGRHDFDARERFMGKFDGNEKTIRNLKVDKTTSSYTGLFGFIGAAGEVTNLTLKNADVTGARYTGSVAGWNLGKIIEVTVVDSKVTGTTTVGGVVGGLEADGIVENCRFIGTGHSVNGVDTNYGGVGGIVGMTHGTAKVTNCENTGAVNNAQNWTGGIVGICDGSVSTATITGCTNYGDVVGKTRIGGIVGSIQSSAGNTVTGCTNYGTASSSTSAPSVGGVIGYNIGTVQNCINNGNPTQQVGEGNAAQ